MKAKILVFGEDETLLAVRSMILRDRGMFVASTTSLAHVTTVAEQFEAIVVCTSAGGASREQLHHLSEELSQTAFVFLKATDMSEPEKWPKQVEEAVKER